MGDGFTVVAFFVILFGMSWLETRGMSWLETRASRRRREAYLAERRKLPQTIISDWFSGWQCPNCRSYGTSRQGLTHGVVCSECGTSSTEFERIRWRQVRVMDENGIYQFKKSIDMGPVVGNAVGRCPYCGRDPCGCGYMQRQPA